MGFVGTDRRLPSDGLQGYRYVRIHIYILCIYIEMYVYVYTYTYIYIWFSVYRASWDCIIIALPLRLIILLSGPIQVARMRSGL